ncbi:hypothetical protein Sp245p_03555 [Azospirillum baldaniorum]|uniref:Uncharacterized protein n=1 Tax=Azospirillum baldaniorum TaxID=1064539 RepID=A0A9P1JT98_9PROT|nr:hypothetical protein [Azospirillum baldaniorum]AWJ88930.1 hypothetical protein Sp245p_03555 [Azospirillum baldaniorum]TWA73358.1 hypothetical protein FBZ85_11650 [Azospirillum brasilense]CCC99357.1 conserved protein of unknown function [Azospirillum baldaniorum]
MALSTYSELKAAVADWLNRDDLTAVIPTFIALAEAEFNRRLRTQRMLSRAVASVASEYADLPDNFLQMRSLHLRAMLIRRLEFVTPANFLDLADAGVAGEPRCFTVLGSQIRFAPAPVGSTVELVYFSKIPALSDAAPANWLLDMAPELYLHATLSHSAPYLREDQRVTGWKQLAEDQIAQINETDKRAAFNAGPLTMRTAGPTP